MLDFPKIIDVYKLGPGDADDALWQPRRMKPAPTRRRPMVAQATPMPKAASPGRTTTSSDLRARAETLTDSIIVDLATLAQTFWQIGEKLHEIIDDRLFVSLGFDDFGDYVEARLGVAIAQAYKMVRVVRNYARGDAEKLGLERATSLVRYAKHVGVDPGELVREDAVVGDKPVSLASVRDIDLAARAVYLAKKAARSRAPAARAVKREDRRMTEELAALLASQNIRGARITVAKGDLVIRLDRAKLRKQLLGP